MAYQLKYYAYRSDINDNRYKLEIFQDTAAAITPEEIELAAGGCRVKYLDIKKVYDCVHPAELTMSLLSTTNKKFLSLYTANMKEYMVKWHSINGSNQVTKTHFIGYLNSEVYSEPFGDTENYEVTLTANDGLNVLKRCKFLDESGNQPRTIMSIIDVIKLCLRNIYITDINSVNICLNTVFSEITLASTETYLHKLTVNTNNYIDEDGESMDCREVLEGVLKIVTGYFKIENGSIYITDWDVLASTGNKTWKEYTYDFTYVDDNVVNMTLGDLDTFGIVGESHQLDMIPGFNSQKLTYSEYEQPKLIEVKPEFSGLLETSAYQGTDPNYTWKLEKYSTDKHFNKVTDVGHFCRKFGIGTYNSNKAEYFYMLNSSASSHTPTGDAFTFKYKLPYLVSQKKYKIFIKCEAFVSTKANYEKPDELGNENVKNLLIYFKMKVVNSIRTFYAADYGDGWLLDDNYSILWFKRKSEAGAFALINCNDQWLTNTGYYSDFTVGFECPMSMGLFGDLEITILNNPAVYKDLATYYSYPVYIRSLVVSIVDDAGQLIQSKDLIYNSYLNPLHKNEGGKIELIHGTNLNDSPTSRGSLYYFKPQTEGYNSDEYLAIKQATRGGQTNIPEKLLLNSIQSNYQGSTINLDSAINIRDNFIGNLQYAAQFAGVNFFATGYTIDYDNREIRLTINELKPDNLTIV